MPQVAVMKLYSADLSPYSARVRMQIYAKSIAGITVELPEHWGMPKFRERFPIGRVPVLEIDGDTIPESEVIAEYLEQVYPKPSLLGTTPRETAHIRMLARLGDIYITNNTFALSRQTGALGRRTPAAARDDGVSAQLVVEIKRNLKALDRFIGKDGFACYGYYFGRGIAMRCVPPKVYYGYRLHDDAMGAVAEGVADRELVGMIAIR